MFLEEERDREYLEKSKFEVDFREQNQWSLII